MPRAFQRMGGLLGLILACSLATVSIAQEQANDELVGLVIDLLSDQDKDIRALGLEQVRTQAPGAAATEQFAEQLPKLSPEAQVGLLRALTERGDATARPAVRGLLAESQDELVRIAAIEALGALGDQSDLRNLLELLSDGSPTEQAAARSSLIRLGGEATAATIASTMKRVPPSLRAKLIEILADRRALETIPANSIVRRRYSTRSPLRRDGRPRGTGRPRTDSRHVAGSPASGAGART